MNHNITWGHYIDLRPEQIESIQNEIPIAYLPWGAIEYHSYHNPVGLDSIKAQGLCTDLAKHAGGLVFPAVNMAANLIKSYPGVHFPRHSLEFSENLIRQMCTEYIEQLIENDFKIIVLLSGHAGQPHLDILKETAHSFNQKSDNYHVWAFAEFDILPDELLVANHSALGETALQLYYNKDFVCLENLPNDRPPSLEEDGISGEDPSTATYAFGKQIAHEFIKEATLRLNKLKMQYL